MSNSCYSCGIPLMGEQSSKNYCAHCLDENGILRPKKEILEGIAQWLAAWAPDKETADFGKRAEHYLMAMPAWSE